MNSFNIDGLDNFEKELVRILEQKYPKELKRFMRKQANDVKIQAVEDTPVDEGVLVKGWKVSTKHKKNKNEITGEIKNTAPHAHLIENGHELVNGGWWEGKHMLEKAVEKKKSEFEKELHIFLDDVLGELKL